MGRDLDRDALAAARLAADHALLEAAAGHRHDRLDRPEQVDQRGDVVGADVEHRAAAALEEEGRVGVPGLHAAGHDARAAGDRPADRALVEQLAGELMAAAEEGVGGAAEAPAGRLGLRRQLARLGERHAERLLRIDVLAGGERGAADLGVRQRRRQVDRRARSRRRRAAASGASALTPIPLAPASAASAGVEVGAGDDLDRREVARRATDRCR